MRIAGVASAFPSHYYSQQEITAALQARWQDKLANPEVANRLLARVGVGGRYLALPVEGYDELTAWGKANDAWIKVGEELAEKSLCRALMCAEVSPQELAAIFFVSITGIASPSIDARLVNRMRLSPAIKRVPIFGLGCVAGAAGLARAADYVRAYPGQYAALVAVELCSLTWQRDDLSVANIISSGLFGDGSAAVIVAGEQAAQSSRPGNGKAAVAGNPRHSRGGRSQGTRRQARLAAHSGLPLVVLSRYGGCHGMEDLRKGLFHRPLNQRPANGL